MPVPNTARDLGYFETHNNGKTNYHFGIEIGTKSLKVVTLRNTDPFLNYISKQAQHSTDLKNDNTITIDIKF